MAAAFSLSLTSATIQIDMAGESFVLTAPSLHIDSTTPASPSGTPTVPASVRFEYDEPYETAVRFPTIAAALEATDDLLEAVREAGGPTLVVQWDQGVRTKIDQLPIIGVAQQTILTTEARLTRLAVDLRRTTTSGPERYHARLSVGLTFTPQTPPSVLGISLRRFGAVVTASAEGTASDLGIS